MLSVPVIILYGVIHTLGTLLVELIDSHCCIHFTYTVCCISFCPHLSSLPPPFPFHPSSLSIGCVFIVVLINVHVIYYDIKGDVTSDGVVPGPVDEEVESEEDDEVVCWSLCPYS